MKKYQKNFELDCENHRRVPYNIIHNPRPLNINLDLTRAIEYLLWYVPNISSLQSVNNSLIDNMMFDNFSFEIILQSMGIENSDVLIVNKIPPSIQSYFEDGVCPNCTKLIFTRSDNETKTAALVRHMRNAIAHGGFTIVEDIIIAFDYKEENFTNCTAILQLRPESLLNALQVLVSEVTEQNLVKIAFERNGYHVEDYRNEEDNFDFYVRNKNQRYALEIRQYPESEYISSEDVDELIDLFDGIVKKDIKPLLVINTSTLTDEDRSRLLKKNLIILDSSNIIKLLNSRDIVKEIEEARQTY